MNPETFPPAHGIPMELLTERALHHALLDVNDDSRREGLPVVIDRGGTVAELMPDQLSGEVQFARNRITELSAEIAKFERSPFSVNETPA